MLNRKIYHFTCIMSFTSFMFLSGCETTPVQSTQGIKKTTPQPTHPKAQTVPTPDGIKITPYDHPEIKREKVPVVVEPKQLNNTQSTIQKFEDGANIPAFQQLLQQTQIAFQKGQWDQAERYALNAQRIAPQSAETFLYLARIANQKKQFANAESLSRRGLSYAQSTTQKKAFWNIILQTGQRLKNQQTIAEALRHLQSL